MPRRLADPDLRMAELVLGLVAEAEVGEINRAIRDDLHLRAEYNRWIERLAPLNAAFPPLPAPDVMAAVERRLFGVPPRRTIPIWAKWAAVVVAAVVIAAKAALIMEILRHLMG